MSGTLIVTSPSFQEGEMIPAKHTCDGQNVSPDISWAGAPEGTRSLLLIMEDPDIPVPRLALFTWVHWIVYNIPPDITNLREAIPCKEQLDNGVRQGMTSFRRVGYGGPCPLFGAHRYLFNVYAMDRTVDLEPREATKKRLLNSIEGHVLAEGRLMGRYRRRR
jgi:hypothetical protein